MDEWEELRHAIENIKRNTLLLTEKPNSFERKNALAEVETMTEILKDSIETARDLFENG